MGIPDGDGSAGDGLRYMSPMPRAPIHRLRAICLALPEAEERETWGESTFRVGDKIFAMQATGGRAPALWCKAPPGSQQILVGADPDRFFAPPYLGHRGWIGVWLDRSPDWREIAALIERSHGLVAPRRLTRAAGRAATPHPRARVASSRLALAVAPLLLAGLPAVAQVAEAHYVVRQAGFQVMEARVVIDLDQRGYRLTAETRTTGLAIMFANSQNRSQAEGRWIGNAAQPSRYASAGTYNGRPRRIEIVYRSGEPQLVAQEPSDAGERVPVSDEQRRGTVDILSALARLVRQAGATGRCDGEQSVYDGRRRLEWATRTDAVGVQAAPAGGPWPGPVLRCAFSSRVVAGFRLGDDPATVARPREGIAWLATVRPDMPPLPVRVEFISGLFGSLRAELVRIENPRAAASDGSGE